VNGAKQFHGAPLRLWHAVQACLLVERLGGGEEWVEQDFLRHDADRRLGIARMPVDVEAPDRHLPAGLVHQTGQDVDHRRLAGAIRAQQPEYLAPGHVQGYAFQSALAALVGLFEIADRNGGVGHRRPHRRPDARPSIVQDEGRC
jgi:hypothetical protein